MVYVGIDIAKLNHYASAISSEGEVLLEPFKFTNDNDGFYTLVSKLKQFEKDKVIIGLESTAHYGNNLLAFLVPKGYNVCLINTAHNVVKNNKTFSTYYNQKMSEGRTHYAALGHCAGKLVRIIYKMLTDNVAFNLE